MEDIFENSLFKSFPDKYNSLKDEVKKFNTIYNGNTIIQDNIFLVVENYCKKNNRVLNIIKIPTSDDNLVSFSCLRNGEIFIVLNSIQPQSNLIFAVAHDLFHMISYIDKRSNYLLLQGSLITRETINDIGVDLQQTLANEFARLLLINSNSLLEQIDIYDIDKNNISIEDCAQLMEIFAVPYKTILLRLHEQSILSEYKLKKLISLDEDSVDEAYNSLNISHKWNKTDKDFINLCGLEDLLLKNSSNNDLPESRVNGDLEFVHQTYDRVNNIIE